MGRTDSSNFPFPGNDYHFLSTTPINFLRVISYLSCPSPCSAPSLPLQHWWALESQCRFGTREDIPIQHHDATNCHTASFVRASLTNFHSICSINFLFSGNIIFIVQMKKLSLQKVICRRSLRTT